MKVIGEIIAGAFIVGLIIVAFSIADAIPTRYVTAEKPPIKPIQTSKLKAVNCVVVNIKGSEVNLKCSQSLFSLSP